MCFVFPNTEEASEKWVGEIQKKVILLVWQRTKVLCHQCSTLLHATNVLFSLAKDIPDGVVKMGIRMITKNIIFLHFDRALKDIEGNANLPT